MFQISLLTLIFLFLALRPAIYRILFVSLPYWLRFSAPSSHTGHTYLVSSTCRITFSPGSSLQHIETPAQLTTAGRKCVQTHSSECVKTSHSAPATPH
jgi:hypothetical protein